MKTFLNPKRTLFEKTIRKILRIMKVFTVLMLATVMELTAATVYSQNERVSLSLNNKTIREALLQIEKQSSYSFFYNDGLIDVERHVSISVKDETINNALTTLFKGTNVRHLVQGKQIILSNNELALKNVIKKNTIEGLVTDESGAPLPGVTVRVKGSSIGTTTDFDGNYSLANVKKGDVLVFSFIGMTTKEIVVGDQLKLNITLQLDSKSLEEVVVIGYGKIKKSDVTGAVAQVKVSELQEIPSNNVESLLQGRTAGIMVVNSSQDPGATATIRIRGGSSLNGSNAPLVVVDGFPLGDAGDLKQINPADIQSVEVLKDASASAIYGSRGANGVIMVTTKRAKEGTTEVSIRQQTTVSQFSSKLVKWNDPVLMAQLTNEEYINADKEPIYNGKTNSQGVYYPTLGEIQSGAWPHRTDWDELVFRKNPVSNNTTFSVRNANEKTSFNLSGNYLEQKGVYIEDDYQKLIVNLGVNHQINEYLKVSTSNILSRDFRNSNGGLAYWRNPLWPVYDTNGDYYRTTITDFGHPLAITDNVLNKSKGFDYIGSYLFDFQIMDGLNLKSQVNYKYGRSVTDRYDPKDYTEGGYFNNGAAYLSDWEGHDLLSETYLTYDKIFAEDHHITAMVSHSYQFSQASSTSMNSYNFVNEALQNENMGAGDPEKNVHSNNKTTTELLSYIGRLNYILKDKYMFTATFRADGSSKFGENNRWAYFPSGAVSWKMHNEDFIKDLNIFQELKLRASYGISGNQGISPYQTLSRYGTETYYDAGAWRTAIGPGRIIGYTGADDRFKVWGGIPNKDLRWETTAQYNLGLDFSVLNNRLNVTLDYYSKETTDLLRERYLPLSSSYDKIWVNDGTIANRGIEITIDGKIISKKDLSLSATLVFSKNKNEVVDLGDVAASGLLLDANSGMEYEWSGYNFTQFRQSANVLAVGQPVNVFYGYKVDGIVQSLTEGVEAGLTGTNAQPGEFKYLDINKDGVVNPDDRTIIGDPNPDFLLSLNLNFTYKNFDVAVLLNGVFGNDVLHQNRLGQPNTAPLRWTQDNPNNNYPSLYNGRQLLLSDWFVEDGSFLRIQNFNVGYNFNMAKIPYISKLRLYMNASNLYTFTKFKGYDPEVGMDGIYWGGYPRLRNITFGCNLTF